MSNQPSSTQPKSGARAYCIWLVVLALIVIGLVAVVFRGPTEYEKVAILPPSVSAKIEPGYIDAKLPEWGAVSTHIPGFDAGREYVLVGFGQQGFYQMSNPDARWSFGNPERVLSAQLVRRDVSPEIVTDNVSIYWELEPNTLLSSASSARTGEMKKSEDGLSFHASIPVIARQSGEKQNPYPAVNITAIDSESKQVLAKSAAVLGVSPGFGCAHCHADDNASILEVHDRHQGTNLLEQSNQGKMIACRTCHSGVLSHGTGDKAQPAPGSGLSISAAMHGWHAPYLAGRGDDACKSCHTGLASSPEGVAPRQMFARDFHISRGLGCVDCHGYLEDHALALLKAEGAVGQQTALMAMERIKPRVVEELVSIEPRSPWVQEPSCTGCHNFEEKPRLGSVSAFNSWAKDDAALFGKRLDQIDMVRCATCHGAPHALYPSSNPLGRDRDNIPPMQYQQHARALGAAGNCALCHTVPMEDSAHHPLVDRDESPVTVPANAGLTLPVVKFSHDSHESIDCATCHHEGLEDGIMVCASSGCHDGTDPDDGAFYFRNAFHGQERSCFACHSAAKITGAPGGPTACKDCHEAPSPRWDE